MEKTIQKILDALRAAKKVLVVIHVSPDGDTLGSSLALCFALRAMGKECVCVCQDAPPALYSFLPGVEEVIQPDEVDHLDFDTAVAVDVADSLRMGTVSPLYSACPVRLVIDHHGTNDCFGQENWIDPDYSAVGVQIYRIIRGLAVTVSTEIATLLYAAICTDTGNFNYSNTNGQALHTAGDLVEAGVDVNDLTRRIYRTRSRESVLLLSRALGSMRFHSQCNVVSMFLTNEDFTEIGAAESMTEGIVNYGIEILDTKAACVARESEEGIKFSLRAVEPYDVSVVAKRLGGGGHPQAAGVTIRASMEAALSQVIDALCQMVEGCG